MPRYINSTRRTKLRSNRFYHREWQDPFPNVPGTRPEKMVYAQLMFRGINFQFISLFHVNLPLLEISKDYRPDFVLPDLKIIIEVQGVYWHSKPGALEADAYKQALYNMMGYEVLSWWDYEIEQNVVDLFVQHPKLSMYRSTGGRIVKPTDQDQLAKKIDNSAGVRTTNARRFRAKTPTTRRRGTRRRVITSYNV